MPHESTDHKNFIRYIVTCLQNQDLKQEHKHENYLQHLSVSSTIIRNIYG